MASEVNHSNNRSRLFCSRFSVPVSFEAASSVSWGACESDVIRGLTWFGQTSCSSLLLSHASEHTMTDATIVDYYSNECSFFTQPGVRWIKSLLVKTPKKPKSRKHNVTSLPHLSQVWILLIGWVHWTRSFSPSRIILYMLAFTPFDVSQYCGMHSILTTALVDIIVAAITEAFLQNLLIADYKHRLGVDCLADPSSVPRSNCWLPEALLSSIPCTLFSKTKGELRASSHR